MRARAWLPPLLVLLALPLPTDAAGWVPANPDVQYEVVEGSPRLDGAAWAWTGDVLVVFGPADENGTRPVLAHDPATGTTRTSQHRLPVEAWEQPGQAVALEGQDYLLGLARTECPTDACYTMGLPVVFVHDPGEDTLQRLELDAPVPVGAVPVATDDAIYLFGGEGADRVTRLDPGTGEVRTLDDRLAAPVGRASRADAVWTGEVVVVLTESSFDPETGTWPNVVAYDPRTGSSRVVGEHGFALFRDPAAAWDGREVWVAGGRASSGLAPPGAVVALDPETGALRDVARLPGQAHARGLLRVGDRFLAVGLHDGCGAPVDAVWLEPRAPDGEGEPPVARLTHRAGYNEERGEFLVFIDACASTDADGLVVGYEVPLNGFLPPGEHIVTGRVWDDDGLSGETSYTFRLDDRPPVASWTWTVSGLTVAVDASESHDPTEGLAGYGWAWGDGTYTNTERATGTHPVRAEHTYDRPGTYNVTFGVRAEDGQAAASTQVVRVGDAAARDGERTAQEARGGRDAPLAPLLAAGALAAAVAVRRRR